MKEKISISVIVASYNYEQYIRETLASLIEQSHKPLEIIVVDDGSKDLSVNIIKEYTSNFSNVKLYTHPDNQNKGLVETVKLGIEKANGTHIAFCESDDYWSLDHIECLEHLIRKKPNANFIANGIKVINLTGNSEYDSYIASSSSFLKKHSGSNIFSYLNSNYIPTFSAVCIKKSVIQKANFDTPNPAWLDFWVWRQLCISNKVYFIPKALTYWRKHDKSYDAISSNKDFEGFLKKSDQYLVAHYGLTQIIQQTITKRQKGFFGWLKNILEQ